MRYFSNKRVAIIYLGRRGAGGWISFELARQLQEMFPTLVVTSRYSEQQQKWETLHAEKLVIPTFRSTLQALISLLFPVRVNHLVQMLRGFKPDVLLFPMFHPWNSLIQTRMRNIPSIVFVHDPLSHPDLAGWFYNRLEKVSIGYAERCILMSHSLVDVLRERGISPARIDVINLGPFRIEPTWNRTLEKQNVFNLLFFGRIVPYKGLEVLLQAYASLRKTHRAHLVIAGEGDLNHFQNHLKNLPDVKIYNHWIPENEIEKLFSQSDLLILPYTSASQSGVIPIAASFGLPVIATKTGGLPEQIEAGISGWLVQPGDADALAQAMKEALDYPESAHKRGKALRARYEGEFSWEQSARQVAESLEKAVQARERS